MGEDSEDYRITQLEKANEKLTLATDKVKDNIIAIEKSNIRIEIDLKSILNTYNVIRNTAIGVLVVNVIGVLWAINK